MTDRTAIDALIAAVEAGEARDIQIGILSIESGISETHLVCGSYCGSLDAALALHEMLLPGWLVAANFSSFAAGGLWCGIYGPLAPDASKWAFAPRYEAISATFARAWLLAILRAYRETRQVTPTEKETRNG